MTKSDVNGNNTNEVYQWLKSKKSGILGLTRIKACAFSSFVFRYFY
jgi:glutathione peroxidase-family protein